MELVDTHCHLTFDPLARDLAGVIARARERGVTRIVVPSYDLSSWDAVEQAAGHPGVYPALGLHPWAAHEPLSFSELEERLVESRAVAVGEIGLDFKVDSFDRSRQLDLLTGQLEVAVRLGLPVLLHCRGAFEELLDVLAGFGGRARGAVHAFSRGPELARRFLDLGLHISMGGAVTRPRA